MRARGLSVDGFVIVDKPVGYTSYDVIRFLKRNWGIKKAGHLGVLDPFATGVLPIALGKGTKIIPFLEKKDSKDYIARIKLGEKTDTDDLLGRVINKVDLSKRDIRIEHINLILKKFKGIIEQVPPMFSSVKKDGVRAYSRARRGESVELSPRKVEIFSLEVIRFEKPYLDIRVLCSRGTYVRALARDIGDALGVGGHLVGLRRLKSCIFTEDQAHKITELFEFKPELILPIEDVLKDFKTLRLEIGGVRDFVQGSPVSIGDVKDTELRLDNGEIVRIFSDDGKLIGLGEVDMDVKKYGKKYIGEPMVIKPLRVLL